MFLVTLTRSSNSSSATSSSFTSLSSSTNLSSSTWSSSSISQSSDSASRSSTLFQTTTPTSGHITSLNLTNTSHGNTSSAINKTTTKYETFPDYYHSWATIDEPILCVGTIPPKFTYPIQTITLRIRESWAYSYYRDQYGELTDSSSLVPSRLTTYTTEKVPGWNGYGVGPQEPDKWCCGTCEVYFPLIDVFYWPVAGANTSCVTVSSDVNSTDHDTPPHRARPRGITPQAGQSTVISDGFT